MGDRLDGDLLDDDVLAAHDGSARAAQGAFAAPGAMEAACAVSYGPVPGAVYAGPTSAVWSSLGVTVVADNSAAGFDPPPWGDCRRHSDVDTD